MQIRRRIVVLTELVERGLTIVELLTNSTTDGVVCANSDELSRVVNEGKTDAIVIDHQLSGFLNGLDIVERLSRDLVRPVTVLVGDLSAGEKEQAHRLKISSLLPASATPEAISAAALDSLTQEIRGGLSIPHAARMLVRDSDCVAPLPQLLVRVTEFLGKPNATYGELAKEILSDAQVTAGLLKIVNNTAMGLSGKFTKVEEAIKLIGIKRTVALVLSKHLLGSHLRRAKPLPEGMEQKLRQRNVLIASTAATYARMTGSNAADTTYVMGLLQDMGILIMLHEIGTKYFQTLERCATISQLQLVTYERQEFGYTHADVSAAVMQKWELPPRLIRLVLQHHTPIDTVQGSAAEIDLVKAMQIGEAFADCRQQSNTHRNICLNQLVRKFDQMDTVKLKICMAQSVEKTLEMSQVFGVPVPDETAFQQLICRLADEVDFELPEDNVTVSPNQESTELENQVFSGHQPEEEIIPNQSQANALTLPDTTPGNSSTEYPIKIPDTPYVVVIDDEPSIHRLISRLLRNRGIQIADCTNTPNMAELATNAIAILCDVHLGRQSGIESIRQLRSLGIDTPVIMMSGDRRRSTVTESIHVGIASYLPKPFDQRTLLSKLEPHLARPEVSSHLTGTEHVEMEVHSAAFNAGRNTNTSAEPLTDRMFP